MKLHSTSLLVAILIHSGLLITSHDAAEFRDPAGQPSGKTKNKAGMTRPGAKLPQVGGDYGSEPALFNEAPVGSIPVRKALEVEGTDENKSDASAGTFLPNTMESLNDKRRLTSGDKLSFKVVEDEGLPRSLTVTDSSEIDVPYLGRISVVGKTCKQFAFHVKRLLEKEYYFQATVIVGLDSAGSAARIASRGQVYVMGQVRSQGAMEIPADETLTVTKAILRAGGFGPYANKRKVKLVRGTKDGPAPKPTIIDCVKILDEGLWDKDVEVNPDDIITVPEKLINLF